MITKICTKCSEQKELTAFQSGHNRCNSCRDAYMKIWADQNREKINTNQKVYQTTVKGRASVLFNAALKRARLKQEPFGITLDDVIAGITPGYCCKTLFPFDLSLQDRGRAYRINPYAPSIDKVNPNGLYMRNNVQYVCAWYNMAKGQMTEADLIAFCQRIAVLNP